MRVNTKIRYGLRTLIEIASSTDQGGMLQKDISRNQNISIKYLDSIISSLKVKGLIANARGKGSGYKLTRPAEEITMLDVYTAFEQIVIVECINNKSFCERASHACTSRNYWDEFKIEFEAILLKKNLAEIIEETKYECHLLV